MDKFDIIKSYLLDEGFAETEESAIGMMVSMSNSWKEEILEGYESMTPERKLRVDRAKRNAYDSDQRAQHKGDKKEADKQFKRRMAMDFQTKMKKEEVEVEEGYKEIDRDKENKMYRRAGNLARTSLSSKGKKKEDAQNKSAKIVSAISRQKENERFSKMADEKARDNYKEEVESVDESALGDKARAKAVEMGRKRRSTKEYKAGGARGTGKNERAAYNLANAQQSTNADLGSQKRTDKSSGMRGHQNKSVKKTGSYDYGAVLDKKDPKKNPKHTDNQKTNEEVQQLDELLPVLAAVPAVLAKGAAVAGKVGAMAAKGAAVAGKVGAKTSGLGMKGKLKLKMKDMAKDAVKSKAQDMASDAKDNVSNAVTELRPASMMSSHEPEGDQINEISAETALAASKGRDKQAMMLRGPENTEKRGELRAKASQNYNRSVKKRKEGFVKNTSSAQGPVRKLTAEGISDIVSLRAEMLKEGE